MYIAPLNEVWDKKFLQAQYTKEFWTEAVPSNSQSEDLIITKIYKDWANKGLISILSLPIYFDYEFIWILIYPEKSI